MSPRSIMSRPFTSLLQAKTCCPHGLSCASPNDPPPDPLFNLPNRTLGTQRPSLHHCGCPSSCAIFFLRSCTAVDSTRKLKLQRRNGCEFVRACRTDCSIGIRVYGLYSHLPCYLHWESKPHQGPNQCHDGPKEVGVATFYPDDGLT
jgi:hypothetical protein